MKKLNKFKFLFFALLLLAVASCKVDKIKDVTEPVKDISGSWRIIKATRNGTDLTTVVDTNIYSISKFRINFSGGKYTITNPLPFLVTGDGTYALDNPQYAFTITFSATGSTTPVSTAFSYPIVDGTRVLNLVFSPGCPQTTYTYSLEKVN